MGIKTSIKKTSGAVLAAVIFLTGLLGTILPQTALAAGESYSWGSSDVIMAKGGILQGTITLNDTHGTVYSGVYQDYKDVPSGTKNDYCAVGINVTLTGDNTGVVRYSTPGPSSSAAGTVIHGDSCNDSIKKTVFQSDTSGPINISGTRPTQSAASHNYYVDAYVYINDYSKRGSYPKSLTYTAKDASGKTVKTVSASQDCQASDAEFCQYYSGNTAFSLTSGQKYSLCSSAVVKTCQSFTMPAAAKTVYFNSYAPTTYAPESADDKIITANLSVNLSDPCDRVGNSIGPYPLTLQDSKGKVLQTVNTDTTKISPTCGGLGTIIYYAGVTGTFKNVSPGTYNVCVGTGNTVCSKAEKVRGEALTVNIPDDPNSQGVLEDSVTSAVGKTNTSGGDPLDCGAGSWNWLFCTGAQVIQKASLAIDSIIDQQLNVPAGEIFDGNNNGYHQAWSSFRVIAVALIIIAGLIMVFSEAAGFEFLDAYTIRKVVPRLLIAIIAISISWPILEFVIKLFDAIGKDIGNLMVYPFRDLAKNSQGTLITLTNPLTLIFAAGGLFFVYGPAIFTFVGTFFLAALLAMIVFALRQAAIIILVITAPVGIACYILPNTQKAWNLWRENFLGLMFMYPIITAMIAAGRIMSAAAGSRGGVLNGFISLIAYFVPYFFLPFAFKLATGFIGNIAGIMNDRGKGGFDRLKNMRAGQREQRMERAGRRVIAKRADLNDTLKSKGVAGRLAARAVGGYNIEAKASARNASVKKELEDQIATGDDTEIRALTARRGVDGKWRSLAGKEVDEASVKRARSRWGHDAYAQQAALSYEMRKAMTDEEVQGVASGYKEVADGWGMSDRQRKGAWIGSAFENAGTHLEYKYTDSDTGKMDAKGAKGYASELYEKKGSYQMSQFTANSFQKMKEGYDISVAEGDRAERAGDMMAAQEHRQTAQKYQAVAETFMQRGGFGPSAGIQPTGEHGAPQPTGAATAHTGGGRDSFQVGSQGSGHVAEAVRDFAVHVGVYRDLKPPRTTSDGVVDANGNITGTPRPPATNPRQN